MPAVLLVFLSACLSEGDPPRDHDDTGDGDAASTMGVIRASSSSSGGRSSSASAAQPSSSSTMASPPSSTSAPTMASSQAAPASSAAAPSSSAPPVVVEDPPPCIEWQFSNAFEPFTLEHDLALAAAQDGSGVQLNTTGLGDPYMSVDASVNLDECTHVEIKYAANASNGDGQIFWVRQDQTGYFNEPESFRWTFSPDGVVRTQRLNLAGHPDWHGMLRSLRFDPFNGTGDVRLLAITIRREPSSLQCPGGCGANAQCISGQCVCNPGLIQSGGGCVASSGGDLASRTDAQVCAILQQGSGMGPNSTWTATDQETNACTLGVLSDDARADAIRRINMYRALVGLPGNVVREMGDEAAMQECARIQQSATTFTLSHFPPADTPCYTQAGGGAAGRANLAKGVGHPSYAIDLYIDDGGVPSLGHRRWILNPALDRVAIGHVAGSNCTGVFYWGGTANPDFVAYPAPGPFPADALSGQWSIELGAYSPGADAKVIVKRKATGETVVDGGTVLGAGYGRGPVISWDLGRQMGAFEIRVTGLSRNGQPAEIVYETRIVGCN